MNFEINIIKNNTESIYSYLNKYSDNFTPSLRGRINLSAFSEKIYSSAIQFWIKYNNEPIAFAACYFNHPQKKFGYITTISVVEDFQNKGIGIKLLNKIIVYAKSNQFKEIRLEVFNRNEKAINFYLKHGFTVLEQKENTMILYLIC